MGVTSMPEEMLANKACPKGRNPSFGLDTCWLAANLEMCAAL